MKKYLIEREIPKVGELQGEPLRQAAATSNKALAEIGSDQIQWVESYVADNKTFCIYMANDESAIQKHAKLSGFPANKITEIGKVISPKTADELS